MNKKIILAGFLILVNNINYTPYEEKKVELNESKSTSLEKDKQNKGESAWSSFTKMFDRTPSKQETSKASKDTIGQKAASTQLADKVHVDMNDGPKVSSKKDSTTSGTKKSASQKPSVDETVDELSQEFNAAGPEDDTSRKKDKKAKEDKKKSKKHQDEDEDEDVKQDSTVMNSVKDKLFEDFRLLKSDRGIDDFKKLSNSEIRERVRKNVDEISSRVNLGGDQQKVLQDIVETNLRDLRDKLNKKKIPANPEDVIRALLTTAENDPRWQDFVLDEKQKEKFEDFVMKKSEEGKNGSLLEDYLRICKKMSEKAENAASDAREASTMSEGSIVNKVKVGANRVKAAAYVALNPCILAALMLGMVGEFLYPRL